MTRRTIRRQLYDLLQSLPPSPYTAQRIVGLGAYFDSLPPKQIPAAERRMLAFTQAYKASVEGGMTGTLEEFFVEVDEAERRLTN
jgi:hypothetical protein